MHTFPKIILSVAIKVFLMAVNKIWQIFVAEIIVANPHAFCGRLTHFAWSSRQNPHREKLPHISRMSENIAESGEYRRITHVGECRRISDAKFTLTGLTKILITGTRNFLHDSSGKWTRKSQRIMCPPETASRMCHWIIICEEHRTTGVLWCCFDACNV